MGANYDALVSPFQDPSWLTPALEGFLSNYRLTIEVAYDLYGVLDCNSLIAFGPQTEQKTPMVADCSTLGVAISHWFDENPIADSISRHLGYCVGGVACNA